ncbi:DUF4350 domain-containing protein [Microbulbifer sp. M83]|uniref:DUF4350 domain-containing protein n=1 Tax=unclassified Microbulbifer TaxID=2619833 RepID=UPI002FDF5645
MKSSHFLYGGFALALAAAVTLFVIFFERYTEERDIGWSQEAHRHPFLAAQRFLESTGLTFRREDNIDAIGGLRPGDTLFLGSSSYLYNENQLRMFMQWVRRGGHAIVVARQSELDAGDPLLESLGVTIVEGELDAIQEYLLPLYSRPGGGDKCELNRALAQLLEIEGDPCQPEIDPKYVSTLDMGDGDFRVFFNPALMLQHADIQDQGLAPGGPLFRATLESQPEGVPLIQFSRGEGRITLLADDTLWLSQRIGQFDHAWLLYQLAGDSEFVLMSRPRFDSPGSLVARYLSEFFLAGALALILWLLHRASRFGLRQPIPDTARRSLREHIAASGYYYWYEDQCGQLLRDYRARILRQLCAAPDSPALRRSMSARLAEATGLAPSAVALCLWGEPPRDEETFTRHIRSLQIIEATL